MVLLHVALYRKYRSKTFSDVVGQDNITSTLKYQTATGRVSHAYLFCGSRGTGKTSCAKILAKAVNCEDPRDGEPCGVCENCRMIDRGNATDVVEMDAASETGVDYIRSIKEEVQYPPALLKKRVYIIDEVHMLSDSAFNALLKTLEEPPEHVIFVLATTELHKVPTTVVSRCQRFDFRRIPSDVIVSRLRYIADSEGIALEDSAASLIARQAQGGMRDAISLLELISGGGAEVTEERTKDILGISGYERVARTADAIARRDMSELFDIVAEVASSSKDIAVFWRELSSFYRDMLIAKYAKDPKTYLDLTDADLALLKECAAKFNLARLHYGAKTIDSATRDMARMPEIKRTTAEFALVKLCDERYDTSPEALVARVTALEEKLAGETQTEINAAAPKTVRKVAEIPGTPHQSAPQTASAQGEAFEQADAPSLPLEGKVSPKVTDEVEKKEEPPANEEPKAEKKTPAPGTAAAYEARFTKVPDLSGVAAVVGKSDFLARGMIAEMTADLIDDGSLIRLFTANKFAETYFDEDMKRQISDAFIECSINDRPANVKIIIKEPERRLSDDLFDNA